MKRKMLLIMVLIFGLVIPTTGYAAPPEGKGPGGGDGGPTTSINLVALGDSIAYGTGATDNYGYVYLYRDYLASSASVELKNHSLKGMKTGDLLLQISVDQKIRRSIKSANIVTISIGGNNLLACASDNYSIIDDACAQNGVNNFIADFKEILKIVNGLNSAATVKVLNLYNPYKADPNYQAEYELYKEADFYISQINTNIGEQTSLFSDTMIDAYTNFSGTLETDPTTYKVEVYTHFFKTTRDPHPTDLGHQVLADLHQ
jgi:lysophospholipase L1-like esterase